MYYGLLEDPRCPATGVPSSLCCRTICSCWLSRPGPVVGVNSGIFQASQPGKYTISSRTVSPPDNLPVSRILTLTAANAELEPSYSSATNLIHETMSSHRADGAETSRRTPPHFHQDPENLRDNPSGSRMPHTMTPGRTLQSNEECPRPPYTVEPANRFSIGLRTSQQRRPGPVNGHGSGDFRPQLSGKYSSASSCGPALNQSIAAKRLGWQSYQIVQFRHCLLPECWRNAFKKQAVFPSPCRRHSGC